MPLLQPHGRRAPAPAPVNLEDATDGQQLDEPGEILTFGQPERRSRLPSGGIPRPVIATVATGIVIGALALAVTNLALRDTTSHIWIKVTNAAGTNLGGAHGAFLMPGAAGRAVPTRPGRPVCP